jgi:hypothetical protein
MGLTFFYDLHRSQECEQRLQSALQYKGFTNVTTTQNRQVFAAYDITAATPSGTTVTYEVKEDRMSNQTGMVAVEIDKRINGQYIRSGLSATQADYIAYFFPHDANIYIIKTEALKDMMRRKEYFTMRWGGDNGNYRIALFYRAGFVKKCTVLKAFAG